MLRRQGVERQRCSNLIRLQDPVPPAGRGQAHRDRPLENARVIPGFGQLQRLPVPADRCAQVHPGRIRHPVIRVCVDIKHTNVHTRRFQINARRVPRRVDEFRPAS